MESQDAYETGAGAQIVSGTPRVDTQEEVELKLLVPSGEMEQIRTAPVIARHARNGGVARELEAVYYDTPDRTLFTHGLSLRVRRNGDRCVQTLKRAPLHGQPLARGEWEAVVDGMAPDLAPMPAAEIGAPLDRLSAEALQPIFTTKVHRRTAARTFRYCHRGRL